MNHSAAFNEFRIFCTKFIIKTENTLTNFMEKKYVTSKEIKDAYKTFRDSLKTIDAFRHKLTHLGDENRCSEGKQLDKPTNFLLKKLCSIEIKLEQFLGNFTDSCLINEIKEMPAYVCEDMTNKKQINVSEQNEKLKKLKKDPFRGNPLRPLWSNKTIIKRALSHNCKEAAVKGIEKDNNEGLSDLSKDILEQDEYESYPSNNAFEVNKKHQKSWKTLYSKKMKKRSKIKLRKETSDKWILEGERGDEVVEQKNNKIKKHHLEDSDSMAGRGGDRKSDSRSRKRASRKNTRSAKHQAPMEEEKSSLTMNAKKNLSHKKKDRNGKTRYMKKRIAVNDSDIKTHKRENQGYTEKTRGNNHCNVKKHESEVTSKKRGAGDGGYGRLKRQATGKFHTKVNRSDPLTSNRRNRAKEQYARKQSGGRKKSSEESHSDWTDNSEVRNAKVKRDGRSFSVESYNGRGDSKKKRGDSDERYCEDSKLDKIRQSRNTVDKKKSRHESAKKRRKQKGPVLNFSESTLNSGSAANTMDRKWDTGESVDKLSKPASDATNVSGRKELNKKRKRLRKKAKIYDWCNNRVLYIHHDAHERKAKKNHKTTNGYSAPSDSNDSVQSLPEESLPMAKRRLSEILSVQTAKQTTKSLAPSVVFEDVKKDDFLKRLRPLKNGEDGRRDIRWGATDQESKLNIDDGKSARRKKNRWAETDPESGSYSNNADYKNSKKLRRGKSRNNSEKKAKTKKRGKSNNNRYRDNSAEKQNKENKNRMKEKRKKKILNETAKKDPQTKFTEKHRDAANNRSDHKNRRHPAKSCQKDNRRAPLVSRTEERVIAARSLGPEVGRHKIRDWNVALRMSEVRRPGKNPTQMGESMNF